MKITKYIHACLLVETPERTALFDPGVYSRDALDINKINRLDDIFITHVHADHCDIDKLELILAKFPEVRITTNPEVVAALAARGITATNQAPEGVSFFESAHENVGPFNPQPDNIGIHYLDMLTVPGDSHNFKETKQILALPITAPWGATIKAINLAIQLKPQHVLPIHDWHWSDTARAAMYTKYEKILGEQGIKLHKLETGVPVEIE